MFRSVSELAGLVRDGELTARELVEESLTAIDALQPQVNAFTHVAHESALATAAEIGAGDPRPFAGVPIAIKDNRPVAGMPMTMCSDLWGDFSPGMDAFLVRRLREAGFVIVGKTALPEMGILPTTESRRFGPTRNPWDLDRTPGGSSGGSAAAVAAGMVPIAHGNDGGGSTRIPAACCGLVGLKATRNRVSVGPFNGESPLTVDGVLTRTVAETASVLDILAGYELGDANWAPPPSESFAEAAARTPGRLRIAVTLSSPLADAALDPECARGATEVASLLGSLGHDVVEIESPWPTDDLVSDFTRLFGTQVSFATFLAAQVSGRDATADDVEPLTWAMYEHALQTRALDYLATQERLAGVSRAIIATLAGYDAVLTPALAQRPLRIGEVHGRGPDEWDHFRRSGLFTPYTALVNVTGLPAISLPVVHGADGLPVGSQLIGRAAAEGMLLALSAQLEAAQPWAERRAPRRRRRRRLARAEHGPHRPGSHPETLGVGGPAPREHRDVEQLGLVGGRERGRPPEQLDEGQAPPHDRLRDPDDRAVTVEGMQRCGDEAAVGERLRAGELVAGPERRLLGRAARQRGEDAVGHVLGPDRLERGPAGAGDEHHRQQRHPPQQREVGIADAVHERGREHRVLQAGVDHRALGDGLGPHQPRARARARPEGRDEHEPAHPLPLGGADQPPCRDPGELLDRAGRLVADHRRQVHDGVDASERVPVGEVVGEVAERDLDLDPLVAEAAGIADEAADRGRGGRQPPQQRHSDGSRRAGEKQHARSVPASGVS